MLFTPNQQALPGAPAAADGHALTSRGQRPECLERAWTGTGASSPPRVVSTPGLHLMG